MTSGDREIGTSGHRKHKLAVDVCHPERAGEHATASGRTPETIVPDHVVSGSSHDVFQHRSHFRRAWAVILATLREIFDEAAYKRFLLRTETSRSVASYRDFMQERDAAMTKKPRCC
jgi:predicted ABC-class ATPase